MFLRWRKMLFKIGLGLLVANAPVGYGGLAVGTGMYVKTGLVFWMKLGTCLYVLSWVMLAVGVVLAGRESLGIVGRWRRRILQRGCREEG